MAAMASFLLLPGSGGAAFYWHGVVARLEQAGHEAIAVDFPGDDPAAGLAEYAEVAVRAAGMRKDIVLAAQSMGGFSAPVVASALPVRSIVLVNAMIPVPGETPREWGPNTGSAEARRIAAERGGYSIERDLDTYFLHDMSPELAAAMKAHDRDETETAYGQPCRFAEWPKVPVRVIIGADDRLFPRELQERVAKERLGARLTSMHVVPGGHLVGMTQPERVATLLDGFAREDVG